MYHEQCGCIPPYSLRFLKKNACAVLLSLPIATLVCVLLFSPQESLKSSILLNGGGGPRRANYLGGDDGIPYTKVLNGVPHDAKNGASSFEKSVFQGNPQIPSKEEGRRRNYTIHVWSHGERMKRRFLRSYGSEERDPFQLCSVSNCVLVTDDSRVAESDAVLVHLHQTKGPHTLPRHHPPHQIWIFFTDESPLHTFLATRRFTMRDYDGLFNWSMTYRADSDVPVPYGRTVPLTEHEIESYVPTDHARTKKHGIAILGSNCGGRNRRWEYVRELQEHVTVDVYGGCGNRTCPGHFTKDCDVITDYRFYLAFENSNCDEYVTEKMWWNAFQKGTVPVVMGAPKSDYEKLCPPRSFIHVSDFESPKDLARHLTYLMHNDTAYNSLFEWRGSHKVLNEHGYFGSPSLHVCRMCEALNRRSSSVPKIYRDLDSFWNPSSDCHRSWESGR